MRLLLFLLLIGSLPAAQLSPDKDYADYPALIAAPNGDLFAAWVSYDQKGSDEVRLRRYANGHWEEPVTVTPAPGDYFRTALAIDRRGGVWVTWAAQVNGNFDLYARIWINGKWSAVERLTDDPQPDFQHVMASDSEGNLYLCWQSFRTGDSNIYLKVYDGKTWSKDIAITTHEAGDWQPAIAIDRSGRLHIAYDTYRHGDYDVFLRIYDHGKLSPEIPIASTDKFEGRATVACDAAGRTWIAWDEQGSGWGLDRPLWNRESTSGDWGPAPVWNLGDGVSSRVSIRFSQRIGVAVYQNGNLWTPKGRLDDVLPTEMAKSFEIPHLAIDGKGVPWMFFRRWVTAKKDSGRPRGWNIYASAYRGDRWTTPVKLENSTGSNDQRVAVATDAAGRFWIAWPTDERLSATGVIQNISGRHGKVYVSALDTTASPPAELAAAALPPSRPYRRTAPEDRRHPVAQGEKRYQLYWGDMHRHTEISGDGGYDGTLWDLYRYAIDVAELDYVASTDHFFGGPGANGELHTYDWWRTQKLADLFHARGKFTPLFGYERSLSWPYGHRNVINLRRGATALPATFDNSVPESVRQPEEMRLWAAIRGQDVITIPHTLATGHGTNWAFNDPVLEPLMEIYQGCRMSYETKGGLRVSAKGDHEEGYASRSLDKGYKVGFISSSDHRSTHISYAAVYAEAPTREAIFRGLQQRHAYAATDNIVVDVRMGEAILGDVTTTDRLPELRVMARGTAPIHQVEIIRGGKHIYQSPPGGREVSFTFRDGDARTGESYYYVRLQQEDGQMAWVSPIWVNYQPR